MLRGNWLGLRNGHGSVGHGDFIAHIVVSQMAPLRAEIGFAFSSTSPLWVGALVENLEVSASQGKLCPAGEYVSLTDQLKQVGWQRQHPARKCRVFHEVRIDPAATAP